MKAPKTIFTCTECGNTSVKWLGKCPACGAWNSYEEEQVVPETATSFKSAVPVNPAMRFEELLLPEYMRYGTGMGELDRVLGGGIVEGSVVLLSGEPGIGKSTLLLQICARLCESRTVLYVSGEESRGQLKLRYNRLGMESRKLWLLTETSSDAILAECAKVKPDVMIVDSVQTIYTEKSATAPGSVTQVREAAQSFIRYAKSTGTSVFLVGHVNKEGGISGPKVLEHMVDVVLSFEGDRTQSFRIIRAIKNRFGSTNEIGVFDMTDRGLKEIPNPSEMMIAEHTPDTSGSCAGCIMEGSRPLISEIQALVSPTVYPAPKRAADGFDYNRMCLLLAVLEKRLGLRFSQHDVYLNAVGGLRPDEPAADLCVSLALISALTDRVIPEKLVAIGEVGLGGEIRGVTNAEGRVRECIRLGFTTILIPKRNLTEHMSAPDGARVIGVSGIYETLTLMKPKSRN
jgi:DNA repair protein RadA/Sms